MNKLYILGLIILAAVIIGLAWADELTLTTYYPAPYGVYNDMVVMNTLGVGTTTPIANLQVGYGTASRALSHSAMGSLASTDRALLVGTSGSETDSKGVIYLGDGGGSSSGAVEGRIAFYSGDTWNAAIDALEGATDDGSGRLLFRTREDSSSSMSDRMTIDEDGNVGIDTTDPQAKLHIAGTAGTDGIMFPDGTLQTTAEAGGGKIVNFARSEITAKIHYPNGIYIIPRDDTKPRWGEGTEIAGLATTITPTDANNYLYIEGVIFGGNNNLQNHAYAVTIFQDPSAGSDECNQACIGRWGDQSTMGDRIEFDCCLLAGTTNPTTIRIRIGGIGYDNRTMTINGYNDARFLGGSLTTSLSIFEIQPN